MSSDRTIDWSLAGVAMVTLLAGILLLGVNERRVEQAAASQLETMLMLRQSVLKRHLESLRSEVMLWSSRNVVIDIFRYLKRVRADEDALDAVGELRAEDLKSADASAAGMKLDQRVRAFAEHHHYYDVFFIAPDGEVLYTVAREADYRTNILDGPYTDTGLGRLVRALLDSGDDVVAMEDFSRYPPSNDQPAAFLGARVTLDGTLLGVYAIQIPEQPINEIMQFSAGMGESGETYLVGQDGFMRSTSRFFPESTVLSKTVAGPTVRKALNNEIGVEVVDDYRGVSVLSAYRPFEFEGIRWAMLGEKDMAEIRAPVFRARWWAAGAFAVLCVMLVLLRFMLVRIVLPTSVAALLGLSFVSMESHASD